MFENDKILRFLTKTVVLGVTVGAAPMLTVGCAMPPQAQPMVSASEPTERDQLSQAMTSRDPQAVDAFLAAYPNSRYVPSLLNGLPPSVLACVSKAAIGGLPRHTVRHLSRRARTVLSHAACRGGDGGGPVQAPGTAIEGTSFGSPGAASTSRSY